MAAPKNNQFWKLRSKHGRDKIFADHEVLKEACYQYFNHTSKRKWNKSEAVKSGEFAGTIIQVPTETPFTLIGLCIYLGVNTNYFRDFKKTCSKDFSEVITHVEEIIYAQKFEGASVGAFNANIIARDLGLVDKKETDHKVPEEVSTWLEQFKQ